MVWRNRALVGEEKLGKIMAIS
jgi:hypothetical protein